MIFNVVTADLIFFPVMWFRYRSYSTKIHFLTSNKEYPKNGAGPGSLSVQPSRIALRIGITDPGWPNP